ncbi:F0F1 ATP synthase subunit gamma [Candidatus Saccharibacteria bacterium]|jgi:ATP synthase F1 gamma subunit|nr:F0F1 ATP synthase subunit gamma [Candidatus Saccharibacteria bacterium]
MKRPAEIQKLINGTSTLVNLTGVFEGIASMRIAQIKNQVLQSESYFDRLWQMYSQITIAPFGFGRQQSDEEVNPKELFIVITAEGGFSGDIDQKIITWMLEHYDKEKNDIIVIGHHGAIQLAQRGVSFKKYFKLPTRDDNINVSPIIKEVQTYKSTSVFYQTYISLSVQDVKRISISKAVEEQGKDAVKTGEIINEATYIFEPTVFAVINHLERSMMKIALTQVILESKLAQYASRFRAMTASHDLAGDSLDEYKLEFHRAKRAIKDERLKEMINGLRKAHA